MFVPRSVTIKRRSTVAPGSRRLQHSHPLRPVIQDTISQLATNVGSIGSRGLDVAENKGGTSKFCHEIPAVSAPIAAPFPLPTVHQQPIPAPVTIVQYPTAPGPAFWKPILPSTYDSSRLISKITAFHDAPRIAAMGAHDVQQLQEKHKIHVQAKHAPKPVLSFDDCGLPPTMHINILESGYYEPTPVQMQAIPAGLSGQDVIIAAPTRSGKTAAYLIPTLVHAYGLAQVYAKETLSSSARAFSSEFDEGHQSQGHQGPHVLILVPTHELATQVEEQAKIFVRGLPHMRTVNLSGSLPIKTQIYRLKQNVQLAVATPGRLIDILFRFPEITFSSVYSIVLDEVDMMYSLGFEQQVQRILDVIPEPTGGRQTIVCSATLSKKAIKAILRIVHHPVRIWIGDPAGSSEEGLASDEDGNGCSGSSNSISGNQGLIPTASVKQTILWVENPSKKKRLFSILRDRKYFHPPILIFVESRLGAELLAKAIAVKCPGVKTASMHGENTSAERVAALAAFKDGSVQVMVATGLLARGLDLKVPLVINFDMASSIEEYIHRIGRANAGAVQPQQQHQQQRSGKDRSTKIGPRMDGMAWAITFINHDHDKLLFDFANMLGKLPFGRVTPMPPQLQQLVAHSPVLRDATIKLKAKPDVVTSTGGSQPKAVIKGVSVLRKEQKDAASAQSSTSSHVTKRKQSKKTSTSSKKIKTGGN